MTSTAIDDVPMATIADAFNETAADDSTMTISEIPELATLIASNGNATSMKVGDMPIATIVQAMNETDADD